MQFSIRDGWRWPHLIMYLKLSLYFVLKSIFTFHIHACKWVKLTFYLKMKIFARKTLWLSLSKLHSYPSKSRFLPIRAFKWDIICFCSVSSFCTLSIWTKKTENLWSKFDKILHENDADEVFTSPCNMSIAGVKSSNV